MTFMPDAGKAHGTARRGAHRVRRVDDRAEKPILSHVAGDAMIAAVPRP